MDTQHFSWATLSADPWRRQTDQALTEPSQSQSWLRDDQRPNVGATNYIEGWLHSPWLSPQPRMEVLPVITDKVVHAHSPGGTPCFLWVFQHPNKWVLPSSPANIHFVVAALTLLSLQRNYLLCGSPSWPPHAFQKNIKNPLLPIVVGVNVGILV